VDKIASEMRMPLLLAMLPKQQGKCRDSVKVPRAASARRRWNYNSTAKRCELDATERPMNAFSKSALAIALLTASIPALAQQPDPLTQFEAL
jgi:hypothetical protein